MRRRAGRIHGQTAFAGGSLLAIPLLWWLLRLLSGGAGSAPAGRLVLYCAAGIRPPVEEIARAYEDRYGVAIDLHYGGSGTLLGSLAVVPEGDLYLAADDSFIDLGRERGLVREALPLAAMRPVIGVRAGNPKSITGVDDLARSDLALGLANPEAAAVGKIGRELLERSGHWPSIAEHVKVMKPTVTELATDLILGTIDAAILWDATANQHEEIDFVRVPAFEQAPRAITVGVLAASRAPTAALAFARFLAARDEGLPVFERHGYAPVAGDAWELRPRLSLMSGAMLNAALHDTLAEFAEREGVTIDTSFNGCGILVAQMHAGLVPDAYFSCDSSFMDMVDELFEADTIVSSNPMVILTQKGNPRDIRTLADLTQSGLRVGLAHPEKSALGALSRKLLEREGLAEAFDASGNLVVDSPTGDYLVNQIRTGSLDAVLVYASNAAAVRDHLDVVAITLEGARAVQPFAAARGSRHKRLLGRLLDALRGSESERRFTDLGFGWESVTSR